MLLQKLDTTDYSCLVLPRTLTNRRHRFLCLLRAAQLSSQDCVCSPVLLVQFSRVHRSAMSARVVFRGGKPAHRKVCWLASCAYSHQGVHWALRSQQCRKSEYLKPRVTTYDSSCRPPSHVAGFLKTPLPADYFDRSIICSCCDTHAAAAACPVPFGMRLIRPRASSRCSCAKAAGSGLAADITSDRLHLFLR